MGKIANILRFRLDQIVISAFVGLSAVTHYYVATRLIDYLSNLIAQGIGVITPFFSQEEGRKNYAGIRTKFMLVSKISVFVSVFFCGLSAIYGKPFIERWMGMGFADSALILWIFLIPFTLHLIQSPAYPLLDGTSKHRYYAVPNLIEGVLNLLLSLWFVRKWGMVGVAVGTAIPMTLKLVTAQPYLVCRAMSMPLRTYASQTIKLSLFAGAFLGLGWALVQNFIEPDYARIMICAAAQTVIFWPLAILMGFTSDERKDLMGWGRKALAMKAKIDPMAPDPEPELVTDKL